MLCMYICVSKGKTTHTVLSCIVTPRLLLKYVKNVPRFLEKGVLYMDAFDY